MSQTFEAAAARIEEFCGRVVTPAVYPCIAPLAAQVFQSAEPVPLSAALRARYRPVEVGWRWGPVWSNAWFRLSGRVPAQMAGHEVFLRFSSGTEALLWEPPGVPRHGLDLNHDTAPVIGQAQGGEDVRLYVEAACNRPLGATTFFWDDPAEVARWKEPEPGRLERCELVTVDRVVWRLLHTLLFAARLLRLFPAGDARGAGLSAALDGITRGLGNGAIAGSAEGALAELARAIVPAHVPGGPSQTGRTTCYATGHAHIDTAWLWPIRETRRKCLRTFATACELLERHPGGAFRFLCSQAQQYAWVEEDSPELFARVRSHVAAGRWEPGGAMWVEPDANLPSGESFVRQVLHGTRYWRERFGEKAGQRYLYLPDTFGFPASLPQIIAQCDLTTFITNKLGWNDTNEFPFSTFLWRGIDGTEILSHCTPGLEYNSTLTPEELRKGDRNHTRKDEGRTGVYLQPFGYGDGGGGPTDWMILETELAADCEGMPRVKVSGGAEFCDEVHAQHARLKARGGSLPAWNGELYLERHRGTYTAQAWIKHANRGAEESLRTAEWLAFAGPRPIGSGPGRQAAAALDEAWKLTLLNQFHDILPGSSIGPVYEDARRQYERVRYLTGDVIRAGLDAWGVREGGNAARGSDPGLILNPSSVPRSGVVAGGAEPRHVAAIPAMGIAVLKSLVSTSIQPVSRQNATLSNGLIEATIDHWGRVRSLKALSAPGGAELAAKPLNQLVLYGDHPRHWEAWDIDADYLEHARLVDEPPEDWALSQESPLVCAIRVRRRLGKSSQIEQEFRLEAGSPRLDVRTRVDWHEERTLLRALFPTPVRAREATYGIQFGHIRRPAHQDDPWARAKFEVCAHRWADLSESGRGLALLTASKYGHSCRSGVLGLSLLRSTKFPDPEADMGVHEFVYSLMPHTGDWRAAGVDVEAEALNRPMIQWPGSVRLPGGASSWAPLTVSVLGRSPARIEIAALKPAEADDRLIARLVETRGIAARVRIDWGFPVGRVESVNLVERPRPSVMLRHDAGGGKAAAGQTVLGFKPFEIVSLAVERR